MLAVDRRLVQNFDWGVCLQALALALIGVVNLISAAPDSTSGMPALALRQLVWVGLALVAMVVILVPDYRIYDPDGRWIVENVGVEPDIVVDLHPEEVSRGHDAQLIKGIEVLLEKIENDPRPWPRHEPFPVDR